MSYLRRQGVGVYFSLAPLPDEKLVRNLGRDTATRIAIYQDNAGMRRVLWLRVNEAIPAFHPHFIAPFPSLEYAAKVVEAFNKSQTFLQHGPNTMFARLVDNWDGLTSYHAAEATWWAWKCSGKAFRREKGSHRLGEGGGDRIIPSRDVEAALVRSGAIEPRTRTYAARSLNRPTKSPVTISAPAITSQMQAAPVIRALSVPASPPIAATAQCELFAVDALQALPKPKRHPVRAPVARPAPHPSLPLEAPQVSILVLIENRRAELGLSQREVAAKLGMKQPGYSNAVVRHHDKLGPWALRRAVEFLRLAA